VISVVQISLAVGTSHWTHTNEADFKNGTFDNVVATNLGDLKLSRGVKKILEQDPRVSSVYALAQTRDGALYAGTGPEGVLLRIKDDKVSDAAKLEDGTSIFSLALDKDGHVLIGTGGEKGQVLRLTKDGEKPQEVFTAEGVQYVWAMYVTPDGNIYAATGPNGQLFVITPDGKHEVVLDSHENNLLSLIGDGRDTLYVGTDPNGLVYRVNRKTKDVFVMHDAAESEISALVLASDGTLYAGTGETVEEGAAEAPAAGEEGGRPEGGTSGVEIPSSPPDMPAPPPVPDPNPGEPDPIPKEHKSSDAKNAKAPKSPPKLLIQTTRAEPAQEEPGDPPVPTPSPSPSTSEPAPMIAAEAPIPSAGDAGMPREGGNAIYRITPDGFVTTVFRQPVLVLSIIEESGTLLVGTGSEGVIYQVKPAEEETIALAKVDPKQVMCLLPTRDGRIIMGLANVGGISAMTSGFAKTGTYTSAVLDASQISAFGKMQLHGSLPKGASLKVATRSGNLSEPDEQGWSKWSEDVPATEFVEIKSPTARFLQYRLMFGSDDGEASAVVDDVDVAYQVPNLAPQIKSIKLAAVPPDPAAMAQAAAAGADASTAAQRGTGKQTITWESSDPNADAMVYSVSFRQGSRSPWIVLKEKLKEPTFEWDTRSVADGRYEIRVLASDAAANAKGNGKQASRVSDPIVVDNTAPVIGGLRTEVKADGVAVSFMAVDRTSTLASFEYAVDSADDWQAVLPSDNIADGPEESVSFTATGLPAGPHQVAVRAIDARGNRSTATTLVTVGNATADAKR
jgi:WD40 repeat protein